MNALRYLMNQTRIFGNEAWLFLRERYDRTLGHLIAVVLAYVIFLAIGLLTENQIVLALGALVGGFIMLCLALRFWIYDLVVGVLQKVLPSKLHESLEGIVNGIFNVLAWVTVLHILLAVVYSEEWTKLGGALTMIATGLFGAGAIIGWGISGDWVKKAALNFSVVAFGLVVIWILTGFTFSAVWNGLTRNAEEIVDWISADNAKTESAARPSPAQNKQAAHRDESIKQEYSETDKENLGVLSNVPKIPQDESAVLELQPSPDSPRRGGRGESQEYDQDCRFDQSYCDARARVVEWREESEQAVSEPQ